jgi:hypothetical protein
LKRKSSTDDPISWSEEVNSSRYRKRLKSDSEGTQIKDEPVDEEMLGKFSRPRTQTDPQVRGIEEHLLAGSYQPPFSHCSSI